MERLLKEAAKIAAKGEKRNFKVGCVARRKDGRIVKSRNERSNNHNPEAHAEARVLKKAGKGAHLWVSRINADGSLTMAKPCIKCQAIIISKGVEKVYYSIAPNEFGIWYPQKEPIKEFVRTKYNNSAKWEEID